jgi:hypothetical protein
MAHLLVLCEGDTEKRILEFFLKYYWQQRFQTIEILQYSGNGELKTNFKQDAETQMSQESDSAVLCLVDLYEEPFKLYQPSQMTVEEGFKLVQQFMYSQIKSNFHLRFGAFPVVMEIETWLLADSTIQKHLGENLLEPEQIEHPSAYLKQIYGLRNKTYGKITDGVSLFGKAHVKRVYDDNCPHFQQLIEWLIHPPTIVDELSEKVKQSLIEWEQERDEKYERFLKLEQVAVTDDDLERAIEAEAEYHNFVNTYPNVFKNDDK